MDHKRRVRTGTICCVLFCLSVFRAPALSEASSEVRLTVYPRVILYYRHPTYIRASWWIATHAENRWWSLAWASQTGVSGSTWGQMNGDDSPQHFQRMVEVERGLYLFECCVHRATRQRFCDVQQAEVH